MIEEFGGFSVPPDNLQNSAALSYAIDAISVELLGLNIYPTPKDKAAALAYHIISRHVFFDGNKRTGIHVSWEFLRANGIQLFLDESVIELAEGVAKGAAGFGALVSWMHAHQ